MQNPDMKTDWKQIREEIRKAMRTLDEWERAIAAKKAGVKNPFGPENPFADIFK